MLARNRLILLILPLFMAFMACTVAQDDDDETESPAPPPAKTLTFTLEGSVIEASGSAIVDESRKVVTGTTTTPSPTREAGATPTATPRQTPTSTQTRTTRTLDRGAPGSIAVKVRTFQPSEDVCSFTQDDTLVVLFTFQTDFEPDDVTNPRDFPNNLTGRSISATGRIIDKDECVFIVDKVTVGTTASSPTPRRSPASSPTARVTPSPTSS